MKVRASSRVQRGFTLIELMVSIGILLVVMGAAVTIVNEMVRSNQNVTNSVDMVQQGRQFMDQIASDLHMSGFPSYHLFDESGSGVASTNYAGTNVSMGGIIAASSSSLTFEGDIDNSGNISTVYLQLQVPSGGCPCTLRRGTVYKASGGSPAYYTELTGIMNNLSSTPVFTYWLYGGSQADLSDLDNIRTVRVQLQVQSQHKDIASGTYSIATLDSETRVANY